MRFACGRIHGQRAVFAVAVGNEKEFLNFRRTAQFPGEIVKLISDARAIAEQQGRLYCHLHRFTAMACNPMPHANCAQFARK